MTVSIQNMAQTWLDANTYNAISMTVSSLGYAPNVHSKLINFNFNGTSTFSVTANGVICGPVTTVGNLPSPSVVGAGARFMVTDASNNRFSYVVSGGGANTVPVYSDGTNWRAG